MRRSLLGAIVLTVLAHAAPVSAQSAFGGEIQARNFFDLWTKTCLMNFKTPDELVAELNADKRFTKDPSYASQILGKKQGTVWDASNDRSQQAVTVYKYVVSTAGDRCQAQIRKANIKTVLADFEKSVPQIVTKGTQIVTSKDIQTIDGVEYQRVIFTLHRPGNILDPLFIMRVSDSPSAWQAVMTTTVDASHLP